MRSSSAAMLFRFCRVRKTANSIDARVQARRSSSSCWDSSSEIFLARDFWRLYSATLAARMSAGFVASLGSGGRIEYDCKRETNAL